MHALSAFWSTTVEPRYNEVLGTMKITLLYQVSHYIRVKKQRNKKSWDQQNYLVIRGFCYIRPLYNEVPLYMFYCSFVSECFKIRLGQIAWQSIWNPKALDHSRKGLCVCDVRCVNIIFFVLSIWKSWIRPCHESRFRDKSQARAASIVLTSSL